MTVISIIVVYRSLIRPLLGPHCRHSPTCSQYALNCFSVLPVRQAFSQSWKRIQSCH